MEIRSVLAFVLVSGFFVAQSRAGLDERRATQGLLSYTAVHVVGFSSTDVRCHPENVCAIVRLKERTLPGRVYFEDTAEERQGHQQIQAGAYDLGPSEVAQIDNILSMELVRCSALPENVTQTCLAKCGAYV
jgi:hypothetical protein